MQLPARIAAVILDLDGTLLDTEPLYRAAFAAALAGLGFPFPGSLYPALIGMPSRDRGAALRRHFGPGFPAAAFFRAYYEQRARLLRTGIPVKPGAAALLDWLEERGIPKAIATSATRATARAHLGRADLAHRFDALITRDDTPRSKPHPDPFLRAASALGSPPAHCLALEDSHPGIEAAHAAGMAVVMVRDLLEPTDAMRGRCLAIADDLDQVRRLLARLGMQPLPPRDRFRPDPRRDQGLRSEAETLR